MRTQNESDRKKGISNEESREHAGFEMAAEPDKTWCCCSPRFHVLAQCIVILILSLILCIFGFKEFLIWSAVALVLTILVIAIPKFFASFYSFAIQLLFWIAFCVYTLVIMIIVVVWKIKMDKLMENGKKGDTGAPNFAGAIVGFFFYTFIACSSIILLLSLLATFLVFRMTLFAYKNR